MQGPDTDAQDQPPPFTHIRLATHGRSIQMGLISGRHPHARDDRTTSIRILLQGSLIVFPHCTLTRRPKPHRIGPMRWRELVALPGGAITITSWPSNTRAPGTGRRQEGTMPEPDRHGVSARLWRLPGQLLLALINATSILVIVAAILALVAIARINHFAESVVATMTEAVLSKVDLPSKDVLANLRNLTAEVRALGNSLREIKAGENPSLQFEMAQLKEALTVLNVSVDRLEARNRSSPTKRSGNWAGALPTC